MTHLSLVDLRKEFGDVVAIDDVSLEVESGHMVCLVGPSGCGKSTTLYCIAGLEDPSGGAVYFGNHEITHLEPRARNIAMVFQDYALYPHMSVVGNVGFPLKMTKSPKSTREAHVGDVLDAFGLAGLGSRRPSELSGGQRQRVALARAIARQPAAFLMDEPLSNLDAALRVSARHEIKRVQKQLNITTVFVTHDQEEALSLSDKVAVMGDGRVQQYGTPDEVYSRPVNEFVAGFIGSPKMNMFTGAARLGSDRIELRGPGWTAELPRRGSDSIRTPTSGESDSIHLGVRPHDFDFVGLPSGGALGGLEIKGRVVITEPVGPYAYLTVDSEAGEMQVATKASETPAIGERVFVSCPPDRLHVFEASSGERLY